MNRPSHGGEEADPLIEEVRAIRRSICDLYGQDLDKLAGHLRAIEEEYRQRSGRFSGVPLEAGEELFPNASQDEADPFLSDLRKLRKG
jgi:hypothetical protein